MSTLRERLDGEKEAQEAAEREMAVLYAKVAADPAGGRVLADISGSLANPDFLCAGLQTRGEGFLARYREASRIDVMIRRGRTGR